MKHNINDYSLTASFLYEVSKDMAKKESQEPKVRMY